MKYKEAKRLLLSVARSSEYKGWTVGFQKDLMNGVYRATKYGVGMGTTTLSGLIRMINRKEHPLWW